MCPRQSQLLGVLDTYLFKFRLNRPQGGFPPSVWFLWAGLNTVIQLRCTDTTQKRWSIRALILKLYCFSL